jgi:PsbN protein
MESSSPALSLSIAMIAALLGLTGIGMYLSFGPPSQKLQDPFDDHDD